MRAGGREKTMKVDSHQHFWIYDRAQYAWMDGAEMAPLRRDFLPADLVEAQAGVGMEGAVAVQARQSVEESRWLLRLADEHAVIRGVVGWVDLRSPDVSQALSELSRHPKFVGVRHVVQDEPDDQFMSRPEFVRGLSMLRDFDLTYDILIYPRQLPCALELVRMLPDQPFVVDHLAKPVIRDGLRSPWEEQMRELGRHANVFCKVSGLVTEARWEGWKEEDFRPYLDVVSEAFGVDRLMFGSDWPVCLLAADYQQVHGMVDHYLAAFSEESRAKIWGGNAERIYGLPSDQ